MADKHYFLVTEYLRLKVINLPNLMLEYNYLEELKEKYKSADLMPSPLLNGNDLQVLGIKQGKKIGFLLEQLKIEQLNDRIGSKEAALIWLKSKIEEL